MSTKDQERKALERIKKIVDELGENSYVGTAFEGCFEIAEENIEYDAAFSLKNELDKTKTELAEAKKSSAETLEKLNVYAKMVGNLKKS